MPKHNLDLPKDVHDIVIDEQTRIKKTRGTGQYSIECTIFKIIREWERCRNGEKINEVSKKKN